MPRFRSRARNYLITFPQVPENVQRFFDEGTPFLDRVKADFGDPRCCRIGREHHGDGGIHYHIYLSFNTIATINSAQAFDYFGTHGNIKPIRRTPEKSFDYAGKEEMYDWTTANPHDHLLNVASMIQISGQISSAAQIKNHFCTLYVRRLQEIGCYPIRGSSSTPTYTIPIRSPNINHRPSLHRMNATLSSWNGSNRHTLENHEMRGKLSSLALRPT